MKQVRLEQLPEEDWNMLTLWFQLADSSSAKGSLDGAVSHPTAHDQPADVAALPSAGGSVWTKAVA